MREWTLLTLKTQSPRPTISLTSLPSRKWITALDAGGRGLVQTSTSTQRGRKLFVWGMNPGGRRWQEFLSEPGNPYIEIQAGVAPTQFECFPLAGNTEMCWTEAYGLMEADADLVHGNDWHGACAAVEKRLAESLPASHLDELNIAAEKLADRAPRKSYIMARVGAPLNKCVWRVLGKRHSAPQECSSMPCR